jgi:regulator of protease activity HflC (stomatin/prohibitin superfamily)
MEGLASLLQSISEIIKPVFDFIKLVCPKMYFLHDGQRGVMLSLGKVRRKNPEKGPGFTFCWPFEELVTTDAKGGYIDLTEQSFWTKDDKLLVVEMAVKYEIINVKNAILYVEDIEALLAGICKDLFREFARKKSFEELTESERLTTNILTKLNKQSEPLGCKIERVMITDLYPYESIIFRDVIEGSVGKLCDRIDKFVPYEE